MGSDKKSAKSVKEKAAAARAAQQASEKRRERTIRIIGAIGVVVVVVGIVAVAWFVSNSGGEGGSDVPRPVPDAAAPLPAGVFGPDSEYPFGVPFGDAGPDAPVLQLWEDFQCPACASLEAINGEGIQQLALDGAMQLIWRPATFLDGRSKDFASSRAAAAWGCAIDAGKTAEYHDVVYANMPEREGVGWTQQQLIDFGSQAGIPAGPEFDTFSQCVTDYTYLGWVANSAAAFANAGIQGTPTGFLDGSELGGAELADIAELTRRVEEAAAAR